MSSAMDAHALPRAVLEEVAASKAKPHVWSDEYVKTVTDWARHHGIRGAIDRHAKGEQKDVKLPWSTVDRWLQYFIKNNTYYGHSKRGRKRILTDSEVDELKDATKKMRASPTSEALTSGTGAAPHPLALTYNHSFAVAAIARGVVARTRPAQLAKNGGQYHLNNSWARYHLSKDNWRPLAANSDRTVPPEQVLVKYIHFVPFHIA